MRSSKSKLNIGGLSVKKVSKESLKEGANHDFFNGRIELARKTYFTHKRFSYVVERKFLNATRTLLSLRQLEPAEPMIVFYDIFVRREIKRRFPIRDIPLMRLQ